MKTLPMLALAALLSAGNLSAQTTDDYIAAGRSALADRNLSGAYSNFNAAVALSPNNPTGNVLLAASRLLLLPQQPACVNFLNRLGVPASGRNIFNWTAQLPHNAKGQVVFPANLNSTEGIVVVSNTILPAVRACLANLAQVTDTNFTLSLSAAETSAQSVTLDYGDVELIRAGLSAVDFFGHTANGYNLSVIINHIQALGEANLLSIQKLLGDYPNLLKQPNKAEITASRTALTNAINFYFTASDFIRTRPPGLERLFNLDPEMLDKEATFRSNLAIALDSVSQPVVGDSENGRLVYAGAYFNGAPSLRSLLPQFSGNRYVNNSLPDYTFGGVLPDTPAYITEAALRQKLGFVYGGIYTGEVDDGNSGTPVGNFALLINSDQTATLLGYDSNQGNGIAVNFTAGKDGSCDFDGGWIQMYSDGSFQGQLWDTNGSWSVSIFGQRLPEEGSFQSADGLYSGAWSGGGETGALKGILSADGQLFYCPFSKNQVNDGGSTQLNGTGHFTSTSAHGATVQGTLSLSTLKVAGTFSSSDSQGSFSMSRSVHVASDTPPVITLAPQDKNASAGDTVTFTVGASGSKPLCYQWYSNSIAIPDATAASLVLTKVKLTDAASYSVAIQNLVGVTNSTAATLSVVPETTVPVLNFTAPPRSFLRVSNAVFTVAGTASDNAAVSNVWFRVGNGVSWSDWSLASNTVAWSAAVSLTQGTNLVQAYALDTSGNQSLTKSVTLFYVPCGVLTLSTSGPGSITPNYSNALVELGRTLTLTAKPASGYVFSNWVDGAGSVVSVAPGWTFQMNTGLVYQANFVPNPFVAFKGSSFAGLFYDTNGVTATNSGFFTATVTDKGFLSSKFQTPATSYSLAGKLSAGGFYSNTISRRGATPLIAQLQLDLAGANSLEGWLSDGAWTSKVEADRQVNTTNHAGKYTLAIPDSADTATQPGGYGFGALTVSPAGKITFNGTLGDGTKMMTQSAFVSAQGDWPFCAFPYGSKGLILGWLTFTNDSGNSSDLEGQVSWVKLAQPKLYPQGFTLDGLEVLGSLYTNASPAINWSNCLVKVDDVNLGQTFSSGITNWLNFKATGSNKLNLIITPASGLFGGTVVDPASGKTLPVNGALLQRQDVGYGVFLGTNQSGGVYLGR